MLVDLSAAFDTIDHSLLLVLLSKQLGISGTGLDWFRSYLTDMTRAVSTDAVESDLLVVRLLFGVIEGSVLGPLLFHNLHF